MSGDTFSGRPERAQRVEGPHPRMVKVKDVAEQIRGVTFAKAEAIDHLEDGFIPVLRAGNIIDELASLSWNDLVYVPSNKVKTDQYLRANDIVIATSSGSLDVIGKSARNTANECGAFGAFLKVLRPNTDIVDPGYFGHFFRTKEYRRIVSHLAAGANINNLRNQDLDNLEIPLPSLDEQRRIAEILDRADAIRAKRRQVLSDLDELKRSVFAEMFDTQAIESRPFGDLFKVHSGQFLPAQAQHGGPYPVYGGNGVNGHHDEYLLEKPTIVIGRVGANCGAVHITEPQSWVTDNALVLSQLHDDFEPTCLKLILDEARLNQYAAKSGQPSISMKRIRNVPIPLPPLSLQREFASRVERIDAIRAKVAEALKLDDELFASLQSRAFRGEL